MTPRPTSNDRTSMPSAHLVMMLGMSQAEAAAYLTADGIKTSLASVRAWSRDTFPVPKASLTALWKLWEAVEKGEALPMHAPKSVVDRKAAISTIKSQVSK